MDSSKALDSLIHIILLIKLASLTVPLPLIKWLASYPSKSSYRVTFDSVPQGSILDSILFLFFVGDLPSLLIVFSGDYLVLKKNSM